MRLPLIWIQVADGGTAGVYRTTGGTGPHKRFWKLFQAARFPGSTRLIPERRPARTSRARCATPVMA
jgi:hypothetical protein